MKKAQKNNSTSAPSQVKHSSSNASFASDASSPHIPASQQ